MRMCLNYVCVLFLGYFLSTSEAVKMTLTPSNVVIGGGSVDPTTPPAGSTQYLTMECTPEGTSSIDTIYSLYIKRKRPTTSVYTEFARIDLGSNQAKLFDNAPQDIRNKNPLLDGQISNNNDVYSSMLRVRFPMSSLDCVDEASYQCEMNYLPINSGSLKVSNSQNLLVTVMPGNLQILGARFDGYFTNPVQNMTILQTNAQYEFTCTGDIGSSDSTIIQWYRKIPPYTLGMFQPVTLTNPSDSIDNGNPIVTICHYSRTSKLRYTPANQNEALITRCQIQTQTNYGQPATAMSQEFHLASAFTSGNSGNIPRTPATLLVLMMATLYMTLWLTR